MFTALQSQHGFTFPNKSPHFLTFVHIFVYGVYMRVTESSRERIHQHLGDVGLSPEQFGGIVGVSGMTIRRLIDGTQKTTGNSTAFAIAKQLDLPARDLFTLDPLPSVDRVR